MRRAGGTKGKYIDLWPQSRSLMDSQALKVVTCGGVLNALTRELFCLQYEEKLH